jgi:conjugative transfer pilus assembly protein TraH
MRLKRSIAMLVAAAFVSSSHASVYSEMQSWFNDMGVYGNVTGPSVIKGQTGTTFSGGSLYMRTPLRNYQILSFTPPSLRAGCGGIDVHAGSFSFINAEQFTALLQNIGNVAIGAAFMIAVESVSPELAGILKSLQSFAQAANNALGNTCQLGRAIGEWAVGQLGITERENVHSTGEFSKLINTAKDSLDQATKFMNDLSYRSQNVAAAKNANSSLRAILESKNVAFYALRGLNVSDDMIELMMSLTGTIILISSSDGPNGTPQVYSKASTLTYDQLVGKPDSQSFNAKILRCMDRTVDRSGCLQVEAVDSTLYSFSYRVKQLIENGSIKVATRSPMSFSDPVDSSIYLNSYVPLWKMVASTAYNGTVLREKDVYAEMVAHQIARAFIFNMLMEFRKALANTKGAMDEETAKAAKELVQKLENTLQLSEAGYQSAMQKVAAVTQVQKNVQLLYENLLDGVPKQLISAAAFGNPNR